MAWRLNKAVVRGEIDNRIKGVVTGRIWLVGVESPIELKLEGNCWRDMAGHLLTFENPLPEKPADEPTDLNPRQDGLVGDMTASRKVRVLEIPVEEAYRMCKRGEKPPEHLGNCIYLEWYSDFNGRVVIESPDYRVTISEPSWLMTEEEEIKQREVNGVAVLKWMERLTGAIRAVERREEIEAAEDQDGSPVKWAGKRIEEYLDAKTDGELPEDAGPGWDIPDLDDIPDPAPNPLTEGIDWVLNDHGHPVHPLYLQCFNLISEFRHDCIESGLLDDKIDNPLNNLLFSGQMVNAKLAGALNSIWRDHEDGGFIVAYLKRALNYFNETMESYQIVQAKGCADQKRLAQFHDDFCAIREEILHLMDKYRGKKF